MNPKMRRYAPFALYVAILAAVVSAALYFVRREFDLYLQISLSVLVIALAVFIYLDPDRVRTLFAGRQARYGSNALVMSLAFLGILIVINYLAYSNTKNWDLTEDKENTLAPETIEVLESLEQPVEAVGFYTSSSVSSQSQAEGLLSSYRINSHGKFTYEFVDPNGDPVRAQAANVVQDRTIVLTLGDRQQKVTSASEQELTSALVRLIAGEMRTVYFLSGHGERNVEQAGDRSYTLVKSTLEGRNYSVKVLELLVTREIPEDASLIVIAGPSQPLTEDEVAAIQTYVEGGGSLILMFEPSLLTDFGDSPDLLAEYITEDWGIQVGDDVIIDVQSPNPYIAFGVDYADHAITQNLQTFATVFPSARSVQVDGQTGDVRADGLVFTSNLDSIWAESDFAGLEAGEENPTFEGEQDTASPVPMAAVAQNSTSGAKLIVFGDSDFASDANPYQSNQDLITASVDWAAGQENIINLTPKDQTPRVVIAPQASTLRLISLLSVYVLPGSVLVAGVVVWFLRRRRL